MPAYTVNEDAVRHAKRLIDARQYVLRSRWQDVQPGAREQNAFLKAHSWEQYADWHLGLTEGADDEALVFGRTLVAIGADGLGLISYSDQSNGTLKVAHCSNLACDAATTTTLDGGIGPTSITIGADGLGLISDYDGPNGDLKVTHCTNLVCDAATTATIDAPDDVGDRSWITIAPTGKA